MRVDNVQTKMFLISNRFNVKKVHILEESKSAKPCSLLKSIKTWELFVRCCRYKLSCNFLCISGYITKEIKLFEYDVRNLIPRRILWSKLKLFSTIWYKNFLFFLGENNRNQNEFSEWGIYKKFHHLRSLYLKI